MASPNWHWKSKQVTPWAKEWFERELLLTIEGDNGQQVSITEVEYADGDAELGQRKSKLIAIYDIHLKLTWSGKASDGSDVNGKLEIPEVSHEITLDQLHDYVYNWECDTDRTTSVAALYDFARTRLPTALETKFAEFPTVLMSTHGKDITVSAPASQEPSRPATPALSGLTPPPALATLDNHGTTAAKKKLNTTKINIDASFMASAEDLYSILTDEKRIPQWSRNNAVSNPSPGASFSLFGGNVKGTFTSVTAPNKFVQTWALQNPNWPSGHFATLTTTLEQSFDSTKVIWAMVGVPVGLEDEITRNVRGYYVGGLNSIGCVVVPHPPPPSFLASPSSSARTSSLLQLNKRLYTSILIAVMALLAAFAIPYLSR